MQRVVGLRACPVGDVADPRRFSRQLSEIQRLLAGRQPFLRRRKQQPELGVGVGRTDVLDRHDLAVVLDHHVDRDRA